MRIFSVPTMFGLLVAVGACGSSGSGSYAKLSGDFGKNRILLQFQGAPAGTICSVATPAGTLAADVSTTGLEVPLQFRNAPLSCRKPDGAVQKLNVLKTVPATAQGTASITARLK